MNERDTKQLMAAFDWCLDANWGPVAARRMQHLGTMQDLHIKILQVMAHADIANERETVRVEQFFFALEAHRKAFWREPSETKTSWTLDHSARNKNWKPFDPA